MILAGKNVIAINIILYTQKVSISIPKSISVPKLELKPSIEDMENYIMVSPIPNNYNNCT